MPIETPPPARAPAGDRKRIETHARELARRVLEDWTHSGERDSHTLLGDVQRVFLEEANHTLRQVLFQIGARLELALVKARHDPAPKAITMDERTILDLMDAVERATRVVDTYLDRSRAAEYTIHLRVEPFDLAHDVKDFLQWNGFLDHGEALRLELSPTPVVADRERIRDVLGHLASRFWFARRPGQHLIIRVQPGKDGGAEGFIGTDRTDLSPEELLDEFEHPLTIEAMEIDVPYTRAVLERHGGTLFVTVDGDQAIGFGFTVPSTPTQDESREEPE